MTAPKRPSQLDSPLLPVIFRYATGAQVWIYRRTGGKVGGKWRIGAGFRKPVPTLLLEHRGRKSGKLFVAPLLYMHDGPNVIVVASQGGRTRSGIATWSPTPTLTSRSAPSAARCMPRRRGPQERARLWPRLVEAYADFDTYQSWTDREIPVVILAPR